MRRSAMIPGNPWTLVITLEEDPDSLGCWVRVHELTLDGATADFHERYYSRVADALRDMEMSYGIGETDWHDLD